MGKDAELSRGGTQECHPKNDWGVIDTCLALQQVEADLNLRLSCLR